MSTNDPQLPCSADPDAWFSDSWKEQRTAARRCNACPLVDRCLQLSLDQEEEYGVWGGITPGERRQFWADAKSNSEAACLPGAAQARFVA